jgi:DNA invertase Pin-like site-specific DNA recombinase
MSQTILYARVSTVDQNIHHQKTQAESAGFKIDEVISDHGVSGVATRLKNRPEGKRLFDKLRRGDVLVVRWIDRLGRNYTDCTETIRHFMQEGIIVRTVIGNMTFDGSTADAMGMAIRDAMIGFLAATAQAQAEATKIAQEAGIAAAKSDPRKYLGRKPSFDRLTLTKVQEMLVAGDKALTIAKTVGLSRQAILRIKDDPVAAEAMLERWGG